MVAREPAQAVAVAVVAAHSSPTDATVVMVNTDTAALTDTPTVPLTAPPADIEMTSSVEFASTVTLPRAAIATAGAIQARVSLLMTCTSVPAPTPAVPPSATWPATPLVRVVSVAERATPWLTDASVLAPLTVTPRSMRAWVVLVCTATVTEPATAAVPPTAPATATEVRSSACVAVMDRPVAPLAQTTAYSLMPASTRPVRTKTTEETPTPAVPPAATPPAIRSDSPTRSEALIVMLPPARTVVGNALLPPMIARVPLSAPWLIRSTMKEPVTPAVEPAPPPAAITVNASVASAFTVTSPPTSAVTALPITARTSLLWMPRARVKPTPAVPLVSPTAPASSTNSLWSTTTSDNDWPGTIGIAWLICAWSPMVAWVAMVTTSTMIAPPTPAVPPPTPAAIATEVTSGTERGRTSTARAEIPETAVSEMAPAAFTVVGVAALDEMRAMVSASITFTTMAAPMPLPLRVRPPAAAMV